MVKATTYKPLPSAVQLGEYPLSLSVKAFHSNSLWLCAIGYLSGFVTIPISLAFTPIAILLNMVIGILESLYIIFRGWSAKQAAQLFFQKTIISPCSHLISQLIREATFIAPFWPLTYNLGPHLIASIGACFQAKPEQSYKSHTNQSHYNSNPQPKATDLDKNLATVRNLYPQSRAAVDTSSYGRFKEKVLNPKATARSLFNFTPQDRIKAAHLKKQYHKLALILHSDKNPTRKEEADALFTCLKSAYQELLGN